MDSKIADFVKGRQALCEKVRASRQRFTSVQWEFASKKGLLQSVDTRVNLVCLAFPLIPIPATAFTGTMGEKCRRVTEPCIQTQTRIW